jgi:polysaccharide biosynthesis transport protein
MTEPLSPAIPDRSSRSARFFNHLHRYRNLLGKHWWVPALTLVAALGFQSWRIWSEPPSFISVGRMIVSIKLSLPTGATYTEELSNFLGTQVALMKSGTVLNRAAERVRASRPDMPAVPVALDISVSPKTTIFNLVGTGRDAAYTRAFLDACMEEYINLKREMRSQSSESTLTGITEELIRLERELRKGEEELLSFQATNSVVFLQEQGNSAGSYLVALNRQLAGLNTEHQLLNMLDLEQNLERQRRGDTAATGNGTGAERGSPSLLGADADYLKIRQQIQLLKAEQQEWSEFLRPRHPKMIALNDEISRKEKLLDIFRQQSLDQLENRRNSIALQIENLERESREWEVKSLEVSRRMAEYQRLRANNQRVQNLYDRLLATMQTLGVDKDISPESVTVLERASEGFPNRANIPKLLGVAALIGLALGLGILLIVDRFDDRPNSFTDLQEIFDEPVLGQIPHEKTLRRNGELVHETDDRHAFVEAYRNLRSSLLYMATEGTRPRVILVTSAIPSEGKSLTTSNLAVTIAQSGARVLLIDADLRRGIIHKIFKVSPGPGLSEVLGGQIAWQQATQETATPNLTVMSRGASSRNPGELFLSSAAPALLRDVAGQFDYVMLDSAPVMAADDVTSLAPHTEGVLFVLRAGFTSGRVARAAIDLLYQREVPVLGLVFNSVQAGASDYYYYHYKDYYATYPSA